MAPALNTPNAPATETPHSDTFVLGHLSRLTASLVADGTKPGEVYRQLFATIVKHYRPLVARIDLRDPSASFNDGYHSEKLSGTKLFEVGSIAVSETLTESMCEESPVFRINSLDATKKYVTIGIPIRDSKQSDTIGGVAVALVPRTQADINTLVAELNSLTLAAAGCVETVTADASVQQNADWARVMNRVAAMGNGHEFAFTLVNALADRFDAGKVGLGLIDKNRVKLRAISGLVTFKDNSPGVSDMRQAMEECYDQGANVCASRESENGQNVMPIHRGWADSTNSSVVSLPIKLENETLGIVTLSRASNKPFTEADIDSLEKMLQPFGPPLRLIEKASRSILQHVREDGRAAVQPWVKPKSRARKGILIGVGIASLWFLFGSLTYRPICETVLSPASLNHMAAPFETRIEDVFVRSGETVKAGQVLVRLDSRELRLQKKQLESQVASTKVQVSHAIDQRDASTAALAKAEVGVLLAQLDSINNRIHQCSVRAPADGVVIEADLRTRIGQPLAQGEPLVTFAPGDNWIVEILVPDNVAPYIASGQQGVFRPYSHPDSSFHFDIDSVGGSATVIDGKNVFIAEASLDSRAEWMKAGMKGVGRVAAQKKPVWWVTLHGALDYLQMKFWL